MSFPFPKNPTDGQVVSSTAPDGSILTATYRAAKNEWELTRTPAPSSAISSGAPPMPVVVTATADGQVITWDQVAGRWVAKVPATAATGTTKSFVKAQQADPDQANGVGPAQLRQGDIQLTAENLHKELKFWNGAAWVESLSEDTIKQWISAGSLFRGVVKESGLAALPAVALSNRGFYYSWAGAPGHVVTAADPGIGTDLAGEVLQVGDWIQSDGTKWVHVPGDLLSKQRWDSLGSFTPWSDTSWEKGALVSYQQGFWRANALISPGDDAPEVAPGNKWTDITPHPSIKLAELADVNDNAALTGQDGVVIWSEVDGEFVVSRTMQVDGIEFDASGPGAVLEGLFQGDISTNKNLSTQVPSVQAVADYVGYLELEDLNDCKDLATAGDGEFVAFDAPNNKWVPRALGAQYFLGSLAAPPATGIAGEVYYQNVAATVTTGGGLGTVVPYVSAMNTPLHAGEQPDPANPGSPLRNPGIVPLSQGWLFSDGGVTYRVTNPARLIARIDRGETTPAQWAAGATPPIVVATPPPATTTTVNVGFYQWTGGVWAPLPQVSTLAGLTDVDLATNAPTAGQVLAFDGTRSRWVPSTTSFDLKDLDDVDLTTTPPSDGGTLVFMAATNKWQSLPLAVASLTDVTLGSTPTTGQLLRYNTDHWENWTPSLYTKAEVDNKFTNLVSGIEHEESVLSKVSDPPAAPSQYDLHIVGTTPTGAWVGHANELAEWDGAAWKFAAARTNEAHLVEAETATYSWNGTTWVKVAVAATGGSSAQAGVGEIVAWIGDNFPATDYLECTGQVVAVGAYPDLHTAIGNKYNAGTAADGTTTFALPDLRGYFLRGNKAGLNVGTKQQWTTGRPRNPFTTDSQGNHTHTLSRNRNDPYTPDLRWQDPHYSTINTTGDPAPQLTGGVSTAGAHTHTISGGDAETAPDHFAVKWLIRYKAINGGATGARGPEGPAASAGDVYQIGSVQQSLLTETQWGTTLGAEAGKWVLADGRNVVGSKWATLTGQNTVPDLRGAFIRAAGTANTGGRSWSGGAVGSVHGYSTARPQGTAFSTAEAGEHEHSLYYQTDGGKFSVTPTATDGRWLPIDANGPGGVTVGGTEQPRVMSKAGKHTHTITGGGDPETAPVHISLNTFIKIN